MSSGCKRCGKALPGSSTGQPVTCPSCGVVQGALAEIDEYAAAVVAGNTDAEPPASLPRRRLKVSFVPASPGAGYRSGASTDEALGELTIVLRYFGLRSVAPLLVALAAIGGAAYGWHLAVLSNSFWMSVPSTVLVALFVYFRFTAAFDSLLIRVADGELFARSSRFWPKVQVKIPSGQIQQLFVTRADKGYALIVGFEDFKSQQLVRQIESPVVARYLERQLETVLGLGDRPVAGELSKADAEPKALLRLLRSWALQLLAVILFVVPTILGLRACGAELAVLEVLDNPRQVALELPKAGRIYFTSEVDLATAHHGTREGMPRSVALRIQILDGTEPLSDLTCDPLEMTAWVTNGSNNKISGFWGPMDDCSVTLPRAGSFTLRAWRQWDPSKPRLPLAQTILAARQP